MCLCHFNFIHVRHSSTNILLKVLLLSLTEVQLNVFHSWIVSSVHFTSLHRVASSSPLCAQGRTFCLLTLGFLEEAGDHPPSLFH